MVFLTFSLPLVLTAVSAAHWLSFFKVFALHWLFFIVYFVSVCFSSKITPLCFFLFFVLVSFFIFFIFLVFLFLKLHKGTRTHAQLPRRPVPPPKPRRSKKGVSRCRLRLPTPLSLLYTLFTGLPLVLFHSSSCSSKLLLLNSATKGGWGISRSATVAIKSDSLPALWWNITTMTTVDHRYSTFISFFLSAWRPCRTSSRRFCF